VHAVPEQTSFVHTLPSLVQAWPFLFASAGQFMAPPQRSSMSHSPTAGLQTVVAATALQVPTELVSAHESHTPALHAELQHTPSAQLPLTQLLPVPQGCPFGSFGLQTPPEQNSFDAHMPSTVQPFAQMLPAHCEPGQVCVVGLGQTGVLPVQLLASVATPEAQLPARHWNVVGRKVSVGQASPVPVHFSSRSQSPATPRHVKLEGRLASVGHAAELPLQLSGRSHGPAAVRQTAPPLPGA